MGTIPENVELLIQRAQALLGSVDGQVQGDRVLSVEDHLRAAMNPEAEPERRRELSSLLAELGRFYGSRPTVLDQFDGVVVVRATQAQAYLTLLPAHPGGRTATVAQIQGELSAAGVRQGLKTKVIEAAVETAVRRGETVWSLEVAVCEAPGRGGSATLQLVVPYFDKKELMAEWAPPFPAPTTTGIVRSGTLVARIVAGRDGTPGRSVSGSHIPAPKAADIDIRFGEGVRVSGAEVKAAVDGNVVLGSGSLDVVPFYWVHGDVQPGQNIDHPGHVLVTGSVVGPVEVRAEDIYVDGDVGEATLIATGDVIIRGSLRGKGSGSVEADGNVHARSVENATVLALGEVVARTGISHSDVTSNRTVRVAAERGAIVGGSVSALKGIIAKNVGSDFGTYTTTAVGVDFLSPKRLERIEKRIRDYEQNLAKIDVLKGRLIEARVNLAKMPRDKQDLFISVLQKEVRTREELNSLRRTRRKLDQAFREFMQASIQILEDLYPPVRVQIGRTIEEIRERLQRVTLALDEHHRILISRGTPEIRRGL